MYYLSKFCRICVQSGVKLLDLDTLDFDSIKLSEKLEVCTRMVVGRESLSTEICIQCITKLRISYQFQDMCRKSTKILQGYLAELIGSSSKVDPDTFISTELNVTLSPISSSSVLQNKRKRITKEQRCSLLKKLLENEKIKKERDKEQFCTSGGLRSIINFTRNYEFGWNFEKTSGEPTHLDKLAEFSNNFFRNDFSEFRDTVLYIIENKDSLSDIDEEDDDIFADNDHSTESDFSTDEKLIKFEEVIVEPDIKIKREMDYEDESDCAYNFVEASYNDVECKLERGDNSKRSCSDAVNNKSSFPIHLPSCNNNIKKGTWEFPTVQSQSTAMHLLHKLVGSYSHGHRKTFSQNSVRCRTRNNPYINPMLKEQFLFRSFRCEKCNRYFKSPGYLKAHNSKVHY